MYIYIHHIDPRLGLWLQAVQVLRVEYVFTYSCDADTRIHITYSAWFTLYMTGTRTYSRLVYSQNRLQRNRIPYFLLHSAYLTCRAQVAFCLRPNRLDIYMYIYIYI